LRGTSSEPAVLVFADGDDAGASRLVASLATKLSVTWWRFGLPEESVSVDVDGDGFRLEQPGATVRSADLQHTPTVVYRRRLLQPRSLVSSELSPAADRDFSEREWTSLIEGLLLAEERHTHATWLNPPSATLLTANKLSLLLCAARVGLPVAPFSVSTPVRFPPSAAGDLVTKAISSDERIDETRYFSTARLSAEDLRDLPGTRIPTPSLLQEYLSPSLELRVFYALGEFLTLALTPSGEHVDIRHSPREDLSPRVHDLPAELREGLGALAREFNLGYCTFDLVVPHDGSPALVDVTPNGDWDYFESDASPVVTEFLADTILASNSRGSG
jgi:hypothetical protein